MVYEPQKQSSPYVAVWNIESTSIDLSDTVRLEQKVSR